MEYRITRYDDAHAIADALTKLYPMYRFRPYRNSKRSKWLIGCYCASTNCFLTNAKQ